MERIQIQFLSRNGWSASAIARELGRHRTTVARELRRNSTPQGYRADTAHRRYEERRQACRPKGRLAYEPLRERVIDKIALERLSPEGVAGRLRVEFPHDPRMHVCHETLYQAIYTHRHFLDFLWEFLPQARPKRRKRGQGKRRRGPSIPNRVSISERPPAVEQRSEFGHWEGDLVVGKGQDSFILTLVERASRLLYTAKTTTRRAAEVSQTVVDTLLDCPTSWVKTLTVDNGSEFCDHPTIAAELGLCVYFADPYAAYQRGSNEQVNGLLRRYLPKGTPFKNLTNETLQQITDKINNRPRKCLGYRTPKEVFQQQRLLLLRALRT
jgi:IS30 family transposase